jgi:acyl-CoA thioester hydrolase
MGRVSSPWLQDFPVLTEISVLWGDEDAFAHVNHVAYLRWCETGRVECLRRIGLFEAPPRGVGPIVASITCHYRRPMNYPDVVIVGTRVASVGNSSIRIEQKLVSRQLQEVVADAEGTVVTVDYSTGKSVRVPDAVRDAIARL